MDVNVTPTASGTAITPPKTHSTGKWLANHENPAKRVKTYESPAPAKVTSVLTSTLETAQAHMSDGESDARPSSSTAAIPPFDFNPIDTPKELITELQAENSRVDHGPSLTDLIQGNFGSGADSVADTAADEMVANTAANEMVADTAADEMVANTAANEMVADTAADEMVADAAANEIANTAAGEIVTEQDGLGPESVTQKSSVSASIASDVVVPNSFDTLFKENLEFTMPDDTIRAGLLASSHMQVKGEQAVSSEGPVAPPNQEHRAEIIVSHTAVDDGESQESHEKVDSAPFVETVQGTGLQELVSSPFGGRKEPNTELSIDTDTDDKLMADTPNLAGKVTESTAHPFVQETIAEETEANDPIIKSPSITVQHRELGRIVQDDEESTETPAVAETILSASTPTKRSRPTTSQVPKTSPRRRQIASTLGSNVAKQAPATEPRIRTEKQLQEGDETSLDLQQPLELVPDRKEHLSIDHPSSDADREVAALQLTETKALENASDTFKTPGKESRRRHKGLDEDVQANEPLLSSPTTAITAPLRTSTRRGGQALVENERGLLATPHAQEILSAKKSVRRSSQRITDAPVATPQPTPTKSATKHNEAESGSLAHQTDQLAELSPMPERSSRSRKLDAPASMPKDKVADTAETLDSLAGDTEDVMDKNSNLPSDQAEEHPLPADSPFQATPTSVKKGRKGRAQNEDAAASTLIEESATGNLASAIKITRSRRGPAGERNSGKASDTDVEELKTQSPPMKRGRAVTKSPGIPKEVVSVTKTRGKEPAAKPRATRGNIKAQETVVADMPKAAAKKPTRGPTNGQSTKQTTAAEKTKSKPTKAETTPASKKAELAEEKASIPTRRTTTRKRAESPKPQFITKVDSPAQEATRKSTDVAKAGSGRGTKRKTAGDDDAAELQDVVATRQTRRKVAKSATPEVEPSTADVKKTTRAAQKEKEKKVVPPPRKTRETAAASTTRATRATRSARK